MLPHAQPPALTEEQRQRIARNRLLARKRRQATVEEEMQAQRDALLVVRKRLVATRGRVILDCPFAQKDRAKELGARWDVELRKWTIPQGTPIEEFACWLSEQDRQELTIARREREALLSSSQALAQSWAQVCSKCGFRVDKAWDGCPTCELARTDVEELKTLVGCTSGCPGRVTSLEKRWPQSWCTCCSGCRRTIVVRRLGAAALLCRGQC
jgi:hypothetical protein